MAFLQKQSDNEVMKPQLLQLALLARLLQLALLARQTAKAAKHDLDLNDLADVLFVARKQAGVPDHLLPN